MVGAVEVLAAVLLLLLRLFSLSSSLSFHMSSPVFINALSSKASGGWLGRAVLTEWCGGLGRLGTLPQR